uniref:START domain-containing protein n=1 Tax=Acrobeloides nanus TaxID=290746 RepID=A0A914CEL7_9BILA
MDRDMEIPSYKDIKTPLNELGDINCCICKENMYEYGFNCLQCNSLFVCKHCEQIGAHSEHVLIRIKLKHSPEHKKYSFALKTVSEAFNEAIEIFNDAKFDSKEDWQKEVKNDGSAVYSKQIKQGKVFVLTGELPGKWEDVLKYQWTKVNEMSTYNDKYADADFMVVKSRDYVVARMKRIINGNAYLVARSIELSELPETKRHIRGHIHIGAGRLAPHPSKQDTTIIDYIMCIDLKGLIPKSIANS